MLRQITRTALGETVSDYLNLRDDIIKYRLSASELNALLYNLASEYHGEVSPFNMNDFSRVKRKDKTFVICPMSKDSENESNESTLPNIWELVKRYQAEFPGDKSTLLIPMRFCRGYLKLPVSIDIFKRKHAVLVELNLETNQIYIHDSQNNIRWFCYPDKLDEKIKVVGADTPSLYKYNPQTDYLAYNRQADDYSCGYYVYHYILSILKIGDSSDLKNIELAIGMQYQDKKAFLSSKGVNFGLDEEFESLLPDEKSVEMLVTDWVELLKEEVVPVGDTSNLLTLSIFPRSTSIKQSVLVVEEDSDKSLRQG